MASDHDLRWAALGLLLLAACGGERQGESDRPPLRELVSAAGTGSLAPRLSIGADGEARLAWVEPLDGEAHALRFAVLDGTRWSAPREVARGHDWFVNWADVPQLAALADGTLAATWLERLGGATYAYGVRISLSQDEGHAWSEPRWLHDDVSATEHGFVSLVPRADGSFSAAWLDGRATEGAGHGGHGAMQLRSRSVSRDGELGPEALLDERVCDCCPTALTVVDGRPLAAWRDRSQDEVRDISLGFLGEQPGGRIALQADGWRIDGCPVNGPALVTLGRGLGLVWYSEAGDRPRVLAAFCADLPAGFSTPLVVSDLDPLGSVSAAPAEDGGLWACWLEREPDGAGAWRLARVDAGGVRGDVRVLAPAPAGRAAGVARLVADGAGLLFAWTEVQASGSTRVRTARLEP